MLGILASEKKIQTSFNYTYFDMFIIVSDKDCAFKYQLKKGNWGTIRSRFPYYRPFLDKNPHEVLAHLRMDRPNHTGCTGVLLWPLEVISY